MKTETTEKILLRDFVRSARELHRVAVQQFPYEDYLAEILLKFHEMDNEIEEFFPHDNEPIHTS